MQQIEFRAMGCAMQALLDTAHAAPILSEVPRWFAGWEQQLSRFRSDSELSELNRRGERAVSAELWAVIEVALGQAEHTQGLVTPTLLDALEAAGYDRSFEQLVPTPLLRQAQSIPTAWRAVSCDPATRMIRLPAGLRLDLGGTAKGWAAQQAVERLGRSGPALVDAGGDIAVSGPQADGSPWPIGIANPHTPDAELELLLLRCGGVATSGCDYRRWQQNGQWQHHLIDPRSGRPAITDVLSATVVGPAVMECEAAAKVLVLLGSTAGFAWLEAQPALAGLMILENGAVLRSTRLAAWCWSAA